MTELYALLIDHEALATPPSTLRLRTQSSASVPEQSDSGCSPECFQHAWEDAAFTTDVEGRYALVDDVLRLSMWGLLRIVGTSPTPN
jgi:hypothetical protein